MTDDKLMAFSLVTDKYYKNKESIYYKKTDICNTNNVETRKTSPSTYECVQRRSLGNQYARLKLDRQAKCTWKTCCEHWNQTVRYKTFRLFDEGPQFTKLRVLYFENLRVKSFFCPHSKNKILT
jgi:hypothetical protein